MANKKSKTQKYNFKLLSLSLLVILIDKSLYNIIGYTIINSLIISLLTYFFLGFMIGYVLNLNLDKEEIGLLSLIAFSLSSDIMTDTVGEYSIGIIYGVVVMGICFFLAKLGIKIGLSHNKKINHQL
jgi:mannose/fructose/N-acetylgalactosamine-specific phosphotransferase system component IIC